MDDSRSVYRCTFCGQMVSVVHRGAGELVCCGHPMTRLVEHESDKGLEKHLPVGNAAADGLQVQVGETEHPMTDNHYIQWIEVQSGGRAFRQFLNPGHPPTAFFKGLGPESSIRAYCNVHGLWKR